MAGEMRLCTCMHDDQFGPHLNMEDFWRITIDMYFDRR